LEDGVGAFGSVAEAGGETSVIRLEYPSTQEGLAALSVEMLMRTCARVRSAARSTFSIRTTLVFQAS